LFAAVSVRFTSTLANFGQERVMNNDKGYAAYKAEEQRQANIFAQEMKNALDAAALNMEGSAMLNAGIGACVGLLIEQLGAIGDGRIRKQMYETVCAELRKGMIEVARNPRKPSQVAILGGGDA
jgi:hypothetical protein